MTDYQDSLECRPQVISKLPWRDNKMTKMTKNTIKFYESDYAHAPVLYPMYDAFNLEMIGKILNARGSDKHSRKRLLQCVKRFYNSIGMRS